MRAISSIDINNAMLKIIGNESLDNAERPCKLSIFYTNAWLSATAKDSNLESKVDTVSKDRSSISKVAIYTKEHERESVAFKLRCKCPQQKMQALELACL